MRGDRSSHQQKTQEERKLYWETAIRGVAPTVETVRPTDEPTDSTAVSEPEPVGTLTPTFREGWLTRQLRQEPLRLLLVPLLIALLSWFAYQVYSLNREVGQLSVNVGGLKKSGETLNRELEKAEARVRAENQTIAEHLRALEKELQTKLESLRSQFIQRK